MQDRYFVVQMTTGFSSLGQARAEAPELMRQHLDRSRELRDQGALVMAGAFADSPGGLVQTMAVLTSREAALDYARRDPFVVAGLVPTWAVREWANMLTEPADATATTPATDPAEGTDGGSPGTPTPAGTPGDRDRDAAGRARQARPRDRLGRPLPYGSAGVEPVSEEPLTAEQTIAYASELLAERRPFAAHEIFEARWKTGPTAERDLWQGMAQLCVGVTHAERGNPTGALRLVRRAGDRLEGYLAAGGPTYDLDVAEMVEWMHAHRGEAATSWLEGFHL